MESIFIAIILLCRVVQAIFGKRASNSVDCPRTLTKYVTVSNAISAFWGLILILIEGNGFKLDLLTILIAAFSGITLYASSCFSVYAMKGGTVSLCSMFGTAGMIIPMLAGIFLFGIPVHAMQWLGIIVFMVAAYLLIDNSKNIFSGFKLKTLFLLIGSMLANGATMLAQQLFTAYVPNGNITTFSFLSFAIIALLSSLSVIFPGNKSQSDSRQLRFLPKELKVCAFFLATAVFIINQLATICTKTVSPAILFAFVSGGSTIISTLVAAIMYKEPLTIKSVSGVILGITALGIIKIF